MQTAGSRSCMARCSATADIVGREAAVWLRDLSGGWLPALSRGWNGAVALPWADAARDRGAAGEVRYRGPCPVASPAVRAHGRRRRIRRTPSQRLPAGYPSRRPRSASRVRSRRCGALARAWNASPRSVLSMHRHGMRLPEVYPRLAVRPGNAGQGPERGRAGTTQARCRAVGIRAGAREHGLSCPP